MMDEFEQHTVFQYFLNLTDSCGRKNAVGRCAVEWLHDIGEKFDLPLPENKDDGDGAGYSRRYRGRRMSRVSVPGTAIGKEHWDTLRTLVLERVKKVGGAPKSRLHRNIEKTGRALGLSQTERMIFALIARLAVHRDLQDLANTILDGSPSTPHDLLSMFLAVPNIQVQNILNGNSALEQCGLIQQNRHRQDHGVEHTFEIGERLLFALQTATGEIGDIERLLFGQPAPTGLTREDYGHISRDRDLCLRILETALQTKEAGINILIYGPPGTGKTEFCKVVARELGAQLFAAAEQSVMGHGEPLERNDRLPQHQIALNFLKRHDNALVMFDEIEDVLERPSFFSVSRTSASKIFFNRLLEANPVPTFWVGNDINHFEPAFLRRMTLVIEMKLPSLSIRERIWRRALKAHNVEVADTTLRTIARDYQAPPALADSAIRAIKLAGGETEDLEYVLRGMVAAVKGRTPMPVQKKFDLKFDPGLINAKQDLLRVTERLRDKGSLNFSLCLFGPPGTGKSAYVRHLAEHMGMEFIQKRASDLMAPFLGMTERYIAEAFEQAREEKAFLIFDEADSFLQDRRAAHRSWEISQVNEMLTWMESHPLPFACTTNLMGSLDAASLRRFTFKIKCGYLNKSQAGRAFQHFFGLEAPDGIERLHVLTPGDFAAVKRRADIMGAMDDPIALLRMLEEECSAKPEMSSAPIGFTAP